jgi:hypothetical protein
MYYVSHMLIVGQSFLSDFMYLYQTVQPMNYDIHVLECTAISQPQDLKLTENNFFTAHFVFFKTA